MGQAVVVEQAALMEQVVRVVMDLPLQLRLVLLVAVVVAMAVVLMVAMPQRAYKAMAVIILLAQVVAQPTEHQEQ